MQILIYILTGGLIILGLLISGEAISRNLSQEHPFRKWWEKHIIAEDNTHI